MEGPGVSLHAPLEKLACRIHVAGLLFQQRIRLGTSWKPLDITGRCTQTGSQCIAHDDLAKWWHDINSRPGGLGRPAG